MFCSGLDSFDDPKILQLFANLFSFNFSADNNDCMRPVFNSGKRPSCKDKSENKH